MSGGADKRKYRRISTNWIVHVRSRQPGQSTRIRLDERVRNASVGGVYIETHYPFPLGSLVEFELRLPDQKEVLVAKGVVRWVGDGSPGSMPMGMGVEFVEVGPKVRDVIESTGKAGAQSPSERVLKAVTSTPEHVVFLRFYEQRKGKTVRLDRLGKQAGVESGSLLAVLEDFAVHGLAMLDGKNVVLAEIEDETVRKAVSDWLADHPAK